MDVNKQLLDALDQALNGEHLDKIPNHDDDSIEAIAHSLPRGDMGWHRERLLRHVKRLRAAQSAIAAAEQAQQAEPVALDVIAKLIALTRAVNIALDDSEERDGIDGREHVIDSVNFDAVCDALEALEELPDNKPGWAMSAADKAEWALRHLVAAQPPALAVPQEAADSIRSPFNACCNKEHCRAMLAAAPQAAPLSAVLADIAAERRRQMEVEGWTPEHDDAYQEGHLADAAACYALCAHDTGASKRSIPAWWPWRNEWWKPTTARRDLVKAGALIAAEIERLDRAAQKGGA